MASRIKDALPAYLHTITPRRNKLPSCLNYLLEVSLYTEWRKRERERESVCVCVCCVRTFVLAAC